MLANGKDKRRAYRNDETLLTLAIGIVTMTQGPFGSTGFWGTLTNATGCIDWIVRSLMG